MSYNQLLKNVNTLVRDQTIRAEFNLLKSYGMPAKEAIISLSEKTFEMPDGSKYCLSVKSIERIVYEKKQ